MIPKKTILLLVLTITVPFFLSAQYVPEDNEENYQKKEEKESSFDWDNAYIGGGLGLNFGNITYINVNPIFGYWFSEKFTSGVGINYQYFSDNIYNYSTSMFGGNVFSRYIVYEPIFLHGEIEVLNGEFGYNEGRSNFTSVFVGGGYMQRYGNSFIAATLLYNLNDDSRSPYTNPLLRINFGVNF
jgi:long-subunit fatty acid transport protein